MNLDHAIGTIISRGFTERQARFLVLVARHSGVCVMRQYSAFAGIVFGHTDAEVLHQARTPRLGLDLRLRAQASAHLPRAPSGAVRGHRRCRVPPAASAHRATRA